MIARRFLREPRTPQRMAIRLLRSTVMIRCMSTASAAPAATVAKPKPKSIYEIMFEQKIRPDPGANIRETIDEWANQQKPSKSDIIAQIRISRGRKHYNFALQLLEWMESSKIDMNDADRAIRIDLLAKTIGAKSAEMYFNSLQESAKTTKTYGALLRCYCKDKLLDKALELFAKMRELDCTSALNYINVIALYSSLNQPEQVPLLVHEMEQKKFKPDIFTYNLLINSYAVQKDLDAVEKVLEDMEQNEVKCDWFTYANLATIHINAGMHNKAAGFIHQMEIETVRNGRYFQTLITLYTKMSDLPGVNRTWDALKSEFPVPNNDRYLLMMSALSKLGDLESLDKCFKEWESVHNSTNDARTAKVVLESYLQRDMIQEANALYESMVANGNEPNLRTMELLTHCNLKKYDVDSALKYLETGSANVNRKHVKRYPSNETIEKFLEYFEGRNDVDRAKKFCNVLKKIDRLDSNVCQSLLSSQGVACEA